MIYIVSGFMRSGTSMMMKALEAGGMDAVRSKERDKRMNEKWGDDDLGYVPNEEYYELDTADYRDPEFPLPYEGKLIKCLYAGLDKLRYGPHYRIIFMRRPKEEIEKSCIAAFNGCIPQPLSMYDFDAFLDDLILRVRDRRTVITLNEVWYQDVLDNPLGVFSHLGWPIDPVKAAAIPQSRKARFCA